MKLNELKTRHAELLVSNTDICKQIEEALEQKMLAYTWFNTVIDLNGINESGHAKLYKLKIEGLEVKINHANDFLIAIKMGENLESFDYFSEIGSVSKEG